MVSVVSNDLVCWCGSGEMPGLEVHPELVVLEDGGQTVGSFALVQELVEELEECRYCVGAGLWCERMDPAARGEVTDEDGPAQVVPAAEADDEPFVSFVFCFAPFQPFVWLRRVTGWCWVVWF